MALPSSLRGLSRARRLATVTGLVLFLGAATVPAAGAQERTIPPIVGSLTLGDEPRTIALLLPAVQSVRQAAAPPAPERTAAGSAGIGLVDAGTP